MSYKPEQLEFGFDEGRRLPPPLKWAGGKRWLLPYLSPIFDSCRKRRLVEPFAGGLSIALGLNPVEALINDSNPHLINFYNHLKKGLVIDAQMKNDRQFYFRRRDQFNKLISSGQKSSAKAAELFYYLNRTAFNGLCRFNKQGLFNVPFGKYSEIKYQRDFSAYKRRFRKWKFSAIDFEKIKISENDFIYADPPYDVEFTQYCQDDFGWGDQLRLVEWLSEMKVPLVASNQATPRILKIYKRAGFKIIQLSVQRRISCRAERPRVMEMLATLNI